MHNPRGSNNRLNEASANRANNDRLFDSQNNNRGGVNVGEETAAVNGKGSLGQLRYFEGSLLPIEWTAQHSCGAAGGKARCNIVIQYMCDASWTSPSPGGSTKPLRDGTSIATPTETDSDSSTGLHEDPEFYSNCKIRERNKGLFTADQNLKGQTAIHTRQNPNGDRSGLECPEERDYYPYWHPSPWVDIAVLTSNTSLCPMYRAESQNVKGKGFCYKAEFNNPSTCPLDLQRQSGWKDRSPWQFYRPTVQTVDCLEALFSRDNHLGNSDNLLPMTYMWRLPSVAEACENNVAACRCVVRLRYNISTGDYDDWNTTASSNGNRGTRDGQPSPVTQNPVVNPSIDAGLRLAINTAQFGRTFQDRSHIFEIKQRPAGVPASATIHNINVRGKRGNIVQTYPSVEYDFVPTHVVAKVGDYVHFQWTGSNTHNNGNPGGDGQTGDDGRGRGGTDRHNVVLLDDLKENYPKFYSTYNNVLFPSDSQLSSRVVFAPHLTHKAQYTSRMQLVQAFATGGYVGPTPFNTNGGYTPAEFDALDANAADKGLLDNVSPTFRGPLIKLTETGTVHYMCTRNNNFSNRSQKGSITVVAA